MSSTLRLSLGANLGLAALVGVLLWRDHPRTPLPVGPAVASARRVPENRPVAGNAAAPGAFGGRITPAAVAQLAQLGISRDVLVSALLEDFNRRSTERLVALQKRYAPRRVPDRERVELSRQLESERERELRSALGDEGYHAWDREQTLRTLNRARPPGDELPLSEAEAEQAYRLQKEFDQKAKELQMAMEDGVADQADVGTLQAQAQQALDRDLAQLLGQERFEALRGHTDPTTEVYRTYGDLKPTSEQANAVVQAEREWQDREAALAKQLTDAPADPAKITAELKAIRDAQDEKLRQIFGAAAYDRVKQANDPTYTTLRQYAAAWELKDSDLQPVYENLRAFQEQADRTRTAAQMSQEAGQRVNWREINATIERARQQTEASLQTLIGGERLRRLEQNGLLGPRN